MTTAFQKWITWYLVVAMFALVTPPGVYAGFAPSEMAGLERMDRQADVKKMQAFLELKMVRERLKEFGFTAEEIQGRLSQLNDEQLHQFALKIDDWKVGGESGVGILVGLVVVAILVVILVWLLQHRIVIK